MELLYAIISNSYSPKSGTSILHELGLIFKREHLKLDFKGLGSFVENYEFHFQLIWYFSNIGGTRSLLFFGGTRSFLFFSGTQSFSNIGGTQSFSNIGGKGSFLFFGGTIISDSYSPKSGTLIHHNLRLLITQIWNSYTP